VIRFVCLLFLSVTLFALAGCVVPPGATTPITATEVTASGEEPAATAIPATADPSACRTIGHDMGETQVCGTPTKVVVLGPHMLDILLSLGLQAAGFAETSQINEEEFGKPVGAIAYLEPYVTELPINVGSREEPNLEVLTLLKPDLILSELRDEDQLALLQQIAPTLAYRGNRTAEWQRTIVPIATALNIPAEADRVIDEYAAFLAEKRAELAPIIAAHPRLIFMPRNQDGRITIFTPKSWAGDLLVNLGFELVYVADGEEVDTEASVEIMPTFNTDTIIVGASGTTTPAIAQEMWTSNAVLSALPASQAGRVHFVDYQLWSRVRGPIAARLVTEELISLLAQP